MKYVSKLWVRLTLLKSDMYILLSVLSYYTKKIHKIKIKRQRDKMCKKFSQLIVCLEFFYKYDIYRKTLDLLAKMGWLADFTLLS